MGLFSKKIHHHGAGQVDMSPATSLLLWTATVVGRSSGVCLALPDIK